MIRVNGIDGRMDAILSPGLRWRVLEASRAGRKLQARLNELYGETMPRTALHHYPVTGLEHAQAVVDELGGEIVDVDPPDGWDEAPDGAVF